MNSWIVLLASSEVQYNKAPLPAVCSSFRYATHVLRIIFHPTSPIPMSTKKHPSKNLAEFSHSTFATPPGMLFSATVSLTNLANLSREDCNM